MCIFGSILSACGSRENVEPAETQYVTSNGVTEYIALCDSQKEAEDLATAYGITLKEFRDGVATFESEKNPDEISRYGKKHGLPELSLNLIYHIQ